MMMYFSIQGPLCDSGIIIASMAGESKRDHDQPLAWSVLHSLTMSCDERNSLLTHKIVHRHPKTLHIKNTELANALVIYAQMNPTPTLPYVTIIQINNKSPKLYWLTYLCDLRTSTKHQFQARKAL
jgi:hypothetical protein